LKETHFRDKIGTLSEFEDEMRILNDSIPPNLKNVVFIDDLDRCKPQILSEIIEALQLLEVSRKCIYILGMDMHIVVKTIESEYAKLNPEVNSSLNSNNPLEHGAGYRFLEKIIQARLSIPSFDVDAMSRLAGSLSSQPDKEDPTEHPSSQPGMSAQLEQVKAKNELPAETEAPRDSPEVAALIERYGARYFRNPRRLKRWVNSFRIHVYLAMADKIDVSAEHLARFLVLCEKWPGLVAMFLAHPQLFEAWLGGEPEIESFREAVNSSDLFSFQDAIETLQQDSVISLFKGDSSVDEGDSSVGMIKADELRLLCDWYDFRFYR
ncbi:MAG: hypothetical protein HKN34_12570, partial [Gammaproteobacteria bacterium]|nr:hypothetical protein [Gammaproteobacteria bacterium]